MIPISFSFDLTKIEEQDKETQCYYYLYVGTSQLSLELAQLSSLFIGFEKTMINKEDKEKHMISLVPSYFRNGFKNKEQVLHFEDRMKKK